MPPAHHAHDVDDDHYDVDYDHNCRPNVQACEQHHDGEHPKEGDGEAYQGLRPHRQVLFVVHVEETATKGILLLVYIEETATKGTGDE